MNINAVSSANRYLTLQRAAATARSKDNNGDYDNGTGGDVAATAKALQAGQPSLTAKKPESI
ncbi:hypothetical protein [Propionispora vibrioides]|uniref:Uncharacterized protein n=1 Tax=Propionispora vibrioides TaxID=112903 RepID=A0A1H8XBF8_9FIRM|nr:hypothetical protein [Propionispora vibrioides]SEP37285.1 hypothetical protein SAMN04490178_1226 [Propionispora vibrioides]